MGVDRSVLRVGKARQEKSGLDSKTARYNKRSFTRFNTQPSPQLQGRRTAPATSRVSWLIRAEGKSTTSSIPGPAPLPPCLPNQPQDADQAGCFGRCTAPSTAHGRRGRHTDAPHPGIQSSCAPRGHPDAVGMRVAAAACQPQAPRQRRRTDALPRSTACSLHGTARELTRPTRS